MNSLKSLQKYTYLLILFIPFLLMLFIAWPSLNSQGILGALDAEGHNLRGLFWAHYLLPHGKLHGWFPYWFGGFDTYITYSPLTFYILGLMSFVFNSTLSVRIFCLLCWMGIPFSSYFFLRFFRVEKIYASLGALLSFQLNLFFSAGGDSIYSFGLLPSSMAFVLSIFSLGFFKSLLYQKKITSIQSLNLAVLFSLTFLAHAVFNFWLIFMAFIFLIVEVWADGDKLKNNAYPFFLTFGAATLMTSFWWIPFLRNQATMNVADVFNFPSTSSIFKNFFNFLPPESLILFFIASFFIFKNYFRVLTLQILLMFLVSLILSLGILPLPQSLVSRTQAMRFEGYIQWSLLMLIPIFLRSLFQNQFIFNHRGYKSLSILIISLLSLRGTIFAFKNMHGSIVLIRNQETQEFNQLIEFLKKEMRGGDFVLSETSSEAYISYGSPHFLSQRLPQFLPQYIDLAGSFIEGVRNAEESIIVSREMNKEKTLNDHRFYLRERGVRFILSTQLLSFKTLIKIPWLQLRWTGPLKEKIENDALLTGLPNGNFISVFEIKNYDHRAGLSAQLSEKLKDFKFLPPDHYQIQFADKTTIKEGDVIGINANSFMQFVINGKKIKTGSNQMGLIKVLEEIQNVEQIDLFYSTN